MITIEFNGAAGNPIEYYMISYQVKTTMVKCTGVQLEGLKFNH